METRKFRAYNRTRKSLLGSQIALADASAEHVDTLIGNLAFQTGEGIWLKPCRELPAASMLPLFDLIYLNEENRVLQAIELYPGLGTEPLTTQAASALVLPMGSVLASHTQAGDRLDITAPEQMAEQMEHLPEARPSQTAPEAGAPEAVSPPEEPQSKEVPAPAFADEQTSQTPDEIRQLNEEKAAEQPEPGVPEAVPPPEEPRGKDVRVPSLPDERTWQVQNAIRELKEKEAAALAPKKESLRTRFVRWLDAGRTRGPIDRRHARRSPLPGLVAYHWTGGNPQPFHLGDISESGVYLLTPDRSFPGTIILMTLQRTDSDGEHLGDSISIYAEVVRWGTDGVGLKFILSKPAGHGAGEALIGNPADEDTLLDFLDRLNLPPREPTQ